VAKDDDKATRTRPKRLVQKPNPFYCADVERRKFERALWDGIHLPPTEPFIWVEEEDVEPAAAPEGESEVSETKSLKVIKTEATLDFLRDRYAEMKGADKGYLKGCHERSKSKVTGKLEKQLEKAGKTNDKLLGWGKKHIERMMNLHDTWSEAAKK